MSYYKIDWLAFTIPAPAKFTNRFGIDLETVLQLVEQDLGSWWPPIVGGGNWKAENGRHPYRWRVRNTETKVTLSFGRVNPHVYVEISGQACDYISASRKIEKLAEEKCMRTSRVDFACDIQTDVKPAQFINNMDGKRFKSSGHFLSENGETVYIGSRESERICRVYRYHDPHPRSDLLRIEVELKGEAAKIAASYLKEMTVKEVCQAVNRPYGWRHPIWDQAACEIQKIHARSPMKAKSSTVRWLYGSVAASLKAAILDGSIDPQEWMQSTGLHQFLVPSALTAGDH